MAKTGDTVRFLNTTGGGVIKKIEGRMAFVEENGFETPVLLSEIVVVLPADRKAAAGAGPRLMFDQKAFDAGRDPEPEPEPASPAPATEPELPVEETTHGERLSVALAFEPRDIKRLSETAFNAVLVNDSNYFLHFTFSRRGDGERGWTLVFTGTVAPNELIDLASYTHADLPSIERIALQCVAFKKDKEFSLKAPIGVTRRLDLTKFHKLHCFRPGLYFDTPVIEIPLVKDDVPAAGEGKADVARLVEKYNMTPDAKNVKMKMTGAGEKKKPVDPATNPHKLLPLIEVDLHIGELTDSIVGMENSDILRLQLDEVRKVMKAHEKRKGQKIVFIHGKGDGVLRKAVIALLKKEYPKADLQDASFREYGFGATLVTV